jgi:hypothetical protein
VIGWRRGASGIAPSRKKEEKKKKKKKTGKKTQQARVGFF